MSKIEEGRGVERSGEEKKQKEREREERVGGERKKKKRKKKQYEVVNNCWRAIGCRSTSRPDSMALNSVDRAALKSL